MTSRRPQFSPPVQHSRGGAFVCDREQAVGIRSHEATLRLRGRKDRRMGTGGGPRPLDRRLRCRQAGDTQRRFGGADRGVAVRKFHPPKDR
ncbi:hypothetical protein [Bacteroides acidifaciens]|uniref:hypothetical protein n=1 Tax=Bacteroides acidifaciens TaxID=85831 RepID=UPI003014C910